MSKKQKDIRAYFVSNKRHKDDVVENNSKQSTTNNLHDIDVNNAPEIVNNKEVPPAVSSLSTIYETLKIMQPGKFIYRSIYILLQLYAHIPMPVAGEERSFSILTLIKTKLRNRTDDE
jgi:hypothetical protein